MPLAPARPADASVTDLMLRMRRREDVERAFAPAPIRYVSAELLALLADPFEGRDPREVRARHLHAV